MPQGGLDTRREEAFAALFTHKYVHELQVSGIANFGNPTNRTVNHFDDGQRSGLDHSAKDWIRGVLVNRDDIRAKDSSYGVFTLEGDVLLAYARDALIKIYESEGNPARK